MPYRHFAYSMLLIGIILCFLTRFNCLHFNKSLTITGCAIILINTLYIEYWIFKSGHKTEAILFLLLIVMFCFSVFILLYVGD